ncbi:hypothetical protein BpHYR1_025456 [Brachionus plicatilis]|uniref:Uncharacterized protein n=1 Tax=Brachionus plicatilis TaxID=10195 RepID=A0A3M7Q032_BRAPC|nr:hypothetical protein BpHYR1_025456 [Brachionus plicatilis]
MPGLVSRVRWTYSCSKGKILLVEYSIFSTAACLNIEFYVTQICSDTKFAAKIAPNSDLFFNSTHFPCLIKNGTCVDCKQNLNALIKFFRKDKMFFILEWVPAGIK